jgi:hypothetical protein
VACLHDYDVCSCLDPADLVGVMELAQHFSVGRTTISNWAKRRDRIGMPEPVLVLGCGPVYSLKAVVKWWKSWKPVDAAKAGTLPRED